MFEMSQDNMLSGWGQEKFVWNCFVCVFDGMSTDEFTNFWRCERRGRVHVVNGRVKRKINIHKHHPDPGRTDTVRAVTSVKRRAVDTDETRAAVLSNGGLPNGHGTSVSQRT